MGTYNHKQIPSDYANGRMTVEMAMGHTWQHIDKPQIPKVIPTSIIGEFGRYLANLSLCGIFQTSNFCSGQPRYIDIMASRMLQRLI